MSESKNVVQLQLQPGAEHDVPAEHRRHEEQELQQILRRLTTDMSALAKVKALPRAKALYESLHPETRHGGDRSTPKQVSRSRTWPTFTKHVADTCGIAQSTVYTHLRWAERLETLTPEAESEANATALANQLSTLARIAALPAPTIQRDLALRFDRQRSQVKKELVDHERQFGLPSPSRPSRKVQASIEAEQELGLVSEHSGVAGEVPAEGEANSTDFVSRHSSSFAEEAHSRDAGLTAVEAVLGASTLAECLDGIRELQADRAEIDGLRSRLKRAEERCARLEGFLSLYEQTPLGELFTILGVTTVQDALARARNVLGVSDAAE